MGKTPAADPASRSGGRPADPDVVVDAVQHLARGFRRHAARQTRTTTVITSETTPRPMPDACALPVLKSNKATWELVS